MIADSIPVRIGAGRGIMHNKFAVIDDSITITGSYNWTEAAETKNDENLLVIASRPLAEQFETRFESLWAWAGANAALKQDVKPSPTPSQSGETVYVTKTGKKYHRAGCSFLSKSAIPMTKAEAEAKGYTPCSKCGP